MNARQILISASVASLLILTFSMAAIFLNWHVQQHVKAAIQQEFKTKPADVYNVSVETRQVVIDNSKRLNEILERLELRD